jgi:hypothetical protein
MNTEGQSNEASRGNGAEEPQQIATTTPITPGTERARIEELEEALGNTGEGVTLGKIEIRYECRQKIKVGEYIRSHPKMSLWQETVVLVDEDGIEKTTYLVAPAMQPLLLHWLKRVLLVPCINQDHEFFLWEIPVADIALGQRTSPSEKVRREAAQKALTTWMTVLWYGRHHVPRQADGDLGEPKWPDDLSLKTINMRTFQDHLIRGREHPIACVYLGTGRR